MNKVKDINNCSIIKNIDNISNNVDFIKKFLSKITKLKDLGNENNLEKSSIFECLRNIKDTISNITTTKLNIIIENTLKEIILNLDKKCSYSIFTNLIKNSYEADATKIEIKITTIDRKYIILEYIDNGKGIKIKPPEKIFEKNVTSKNGSTGFGMFFIKSILEKNNGNIAVKKTDKNGTIFVLTIPIFENTK